VLFASSTLDGSLPRPATSSLWNAQASIAVIDDKPREGALPIVYGAKLLVEMVRQLSWAATLLHGSLYLLDRYRVGGTFSSRISSKVSPFNEVVDEVIASPVRRRRWPDEKRQPTLLHQSTTKGSSVI